MATLTLDCECCVQISAVAEMPSVTFLQYFVLFFDENTSKILQDLGNTVFSLNRLQYMCIAQQVKILFFHPKYFSALNILQTFLQGWHPCSWHSYELETMRPLETSTVIAEIKVVLEVRRSWRISQSETVPGESIRSCITCTRLSCVAHSPRLVASCVVQLAASPCESSLVFTPRGILYLLDPPLWKYSQLWLSENLTYVGSKTIENKEKTLIVLLGNYWLVWIWLRQLTILPQWQIHL